MVILPAFHPAYLLRSADGERGEARFKQCTIADFQKAATFIHRKPNWEANVIWERDEAGRLKNLFPTAEEVRLFLERARQQRAAADIETDGEQPLACRILCIGLALEDGAAICIPFMAQGEKGYWSQGDLMRVLGYVSHYLADPDAAKIFHNGSFDTTVLRGAGLPVNGWLGDTMQAHRCVDGELPHGLAYVGSRYLEVPYWKDDVKGDTRWVDLEDTRLRAYNVVDCLVTIRALPKLEKELDQLGLNDLYQTDLKLCKVMCKATTRGIMVDLVRRDALGAHLREDRQAALLELRGLAQNHGTLNTNGSPFKPGSVIQLRKLLFEGLKFPIVARTKKGAPSTDKKAMSLLALHADTPEKILALHALVKWRKNDKMIGTWVEGLPILGDSRVHASWKSLVVSGRLAVSPNLQALNKRIKSIFCAPNGSKFVASDLSQAELRVIAYLTGDQELLTAYEKGLDVHTCNATLLFQVRNPGANTNPQTEAYLTEACPRLLGQEYASFPVCAAKNWEDTRRLAKVFVFGNNYGAEAETLFEMIRAARDPETDEPLFPDIQLATVEALQVQWAMLHPAIPVWWKTIEEATRKAGCYRSPFSGRIRWFRAGFKRNEILNFPVQEMVAAWMNLCTIRIDEDLERWTQGRAQIIMQVHDSLVCEAPDEMVDLTKQIMKYHLSQVPDVPGIGPMILPPDKFKVGQYLNEV